MMNIFDEARRLAETPEDKPEPAVMPKPKTPVSPPVKAPAQIKLVPKPEPETCQEARKRIENSEVYKEMYSKIIATQKARFEETSKQNEKWKREVKEKWKKEREEREAKRIAMEREIKIRASILPRFFYEVVEHFTTPRKGGNN